MLCLQKRLEFHQFENGRGGVFDTVCHQHVMQESRVYEIKPNSSSFTESKCLLSRSKTSLPRAPQIVYYIKLPSQVKPDFEAIWSDRCSSRVRLAFIWVTTISLELLFVGSDLGMKTTSRPLSFGSFSYRTHTIQRLFRKTTTMLRYFMTA